MKFSFEFCKFVLTNSKKDEINELFVTVRMVIYWKDMVKHAKTGSEVNNIRFGKSGKFVDNAGEMCFIGMRGGQVGEGVQVTMEGIDLLLDRSEVNRNGDVDVGHLSGDSADGVKDIVVVMVGEGGDEVLGGRVNKECRED